MVAQSGDTVEPDALRNLFYVNKEGTNKPTRRRNPVVLPPDVPKPLPRNASAYSVVQRDGGFTVHGTAATELPLSLRVQVAYSVTDGNPLRQHSPYDFDFTKKDVAVSAKGASVKAQAANELIVEAAATDFEVTVTGFDGNRDLFIKDGPIQ